MNIFGIGIDICEIIRINNVIKRNGDDFVNEILHQNEIEIFHNHYSPCLYLGKHFAAKEAFTKALGTGIFRGVALNDIEVSNDKSGKPLLNLYGNARLMVEQLGETRFHLSISEDSKYVLAQVIIEKI